MITLPKALLDKFDSWLEREAVEVRRHAEYRRWLLYYLDFCHKYRHGYLDELSLGLFTEKLKDKGQRTSQIKEASEAVLLYYRMAGEPKTTSNQPLSATQPEAASWSDELTTLREEIRIRHYSAKTLSSYYAWARKFQSFVRSKSPSANSYHKCNSSKLKTLRWR